MGPLHRSPTACTDWPTLRSWPRSTPDQILHPRRQSHPSLRCPAAGRRVWMPYSACRHRCGIKNKEMPSFSHSSWLKASTGGKNLYKAAKMSPISGHRSASTWCGDNNNNHNDKICNAHISTLLGAQGANPKTPGQAPFSFTISVLGSFTCIAQHTGPTALRPVRRTKQLWPSPDSNSHSGNTRTWVQCTRPLGHNTPQHFLTKSLVIFIYFFGPTSEIRDTCLRFIKIHEVSGMHWDAVLNIVIISQDSGRLKAIQGGNNGCQMKDHLIGGLWHK